MNDSESFDVCEVKHFSSTPTSNLDLVETVRADQIKPRPIDWMWPGWLAQRKLHLLAGAPGTGKSSLSLDLAATVSCGGNWPDGSSSEPGDVLLWMSEDNFEDTLLPRLEASGADCSRVHLIRTDVHPVCGRPFDPSKDTGELCARARAIGEVKLLIIDPIVAAGHGNTDSSIGVQRTIEALFSLTQTLNCVTIGVITLSSQATQTMAGCELRLPARQVLTCSRGDGIDPSYILALARSNIGPSRGGFAYRIEEHRLKSNNRILSSRILWGQAFHGSVHRPARSIHMSEPEKGDKVDGAMEWLAKCLGNGRLSAHDIEARAAGDGISKATLRRAKDALGVRSTKAGMNGGWTWELVVGSGRGQ